MSTITYHHSEYEIMAPVGSRESLFAAINAGAHSVYFGIGALNMRSNSAAAFGIDDLKEIAAICHEHEVNSYLTVNTVLYDDDMGQLREILTAAKEATISAVIVADPAAMMVARELGLRVHLSTQLNIGNIDTLKFYAHFADTVVLARELTLEQVHTIHEAITTTPIVGPMGEPVRIEMFCHGAMCMAQSGRCFMSLHTRGKSANRGECLQNCRRSYIVKDKERDIEFEIDNEFIMSPKDLKTIGFMDKMIAAGVRVFKIEGRARGPEYVREVVSCYREALEAVLEGRFNDEMRTHWDARLATVFNRGFWDGYYLGQQIGDLTKDYGSSATEKKVFVGTVLNYYDKPKIGYFKMQAYDIKVGDKLLITGPTTGAVVLTVNELRDDDGTVITTATKGMQITIPVQEKIRENDKLYKLVGRDE